MTELNFAFYWNTKPWNVHFSNVKVDSKLYQYLCQLLTQKIIHEISKTGGFQNAYFVFIFTLYTIYNSSMTTVYYCLPLFAATNLHPKWFMSGRLHLTANHVAGMFL